MADQRHAVERHYTRSRLLAEIDQALKGAGLNPASLTPADLAPVDQFHVRGRAATEELARAAGVESRDHILEIGSGIGGAARLLASAFGCRVTGLDLTASFCDVARELTRRVGLCDRVEFVCGDGARTPFAADSFDLVWLQHVTMNIPDKGALLDEIRRVLRPSIGRLAAHEIVRGDCGGGVPHFPAPWARTPETCFLASADEWRRDIESRGFRVSMWRDDSESGIQFLREARRRADSALPAGDRPRLGLHVLMGAEIRPMLANLVRSLEEDRVRIIQCVASLD